MRVAVAAAIAAVVDNRERAIGVNASGRGSSEGSDNYLGQYAIAHLPHVHDNTMMVSPAIERFAA